MEKEFPTEVELTVASALLLLSSSIVFPSTTANSPLKLKKNVVEVESEVSKKCDDVTELSSCHKSVDTTPCGSSLTSVDSVDHNHHQFKLITSQFRELKLKVARRARTKVIYKSFKDQKPAPRMWASTPLKHPKKVTSSRTGTEGTTTTESSCLSSGGSSEISSARKGEKAVVVGQKRRKGVGSNHISRKAEGIKRLLSNGVCASEVRIRQLLGDSPDTSKALRMLLKKEEVKRSGAGGRGDPFIYEIVADSNSIVC